MINLKSNQSHTADNSTKASVVIGKNFGDEGKGMAVDFLCLNAGNALVIRHNGGAQSGHTVELPGKRFVFHQLSSGSFRNADTFWAGTFYPDLYKLSDEIDEFSALTDNIPSIFCALDTSVTLIDDVLINMALEESRGENRHGSCGMGINEADLRIKAGFKLTIADIHNMTYSDIANKMLEIRREYSFNRINKLNLSSSKSEYLDLLNSENVIYNAAHVMKDNSKYVQVIDDYNSFFCNYNNIIFETGQGLLLDADNKEFAPNTTASKTDLTNPYRLAHIYNLSITDIFYVTRSYVTRHGAGFLPFEINKDTIGNIELDRTNLDNDWQGSIRYAPHSNLDTFIGPISSDIKIHCLGSVPNISLIITHLNETNGKIAFKEKMLSLNELANSSNISNTINYIYTSDSHFASDINLFKQC